MFLKIIAAAVLFYVLWTLVALELNYRRAKLMGIPLIRIPIDFLNVPWQVVEPNIWLVVDFFGIPLPKACRYMRRGWHFEDKADTHEELGPIYAFVTPCQIFIQICEPEVEHQVFSRRNDFPRPAAHYKLLAVYGPSISTADNDSWARHRKVLATFFQNEGIMRTVWEESLRQTRQMIEDWTSHGISSVADDSRTVSLNVLAAIGFRKSFQFRNSEKEIPEATGRLSYRNALQIVLDNAILMMLVPRKHLRYSWLPDSMRRIGKAGDDFGMHMQEMLDNELAILNRGEKGSGGLVSSLVRALDVHQKDHTKGMSAEEIFGNMFVINFAGHDTTANTLAFAMLLLSAYPDVQEWVSGEVNRATAGLKGEDWDYGTLFPQLIRCRAVMFETLRLFPPIMSLPKWTNDRVQSIQLHGRSITLPPHTMVMSNTLATHTHSRFWPDAKEWKPSRWIEASNSGSDGAQESFINPSRYTYFPWSDGPQNCPGIKFSQVEFVAVIAYLLQAHRLNARCDADGSLEEMSRRVHGVANDCNAMMLLKMNDPDRVKLRCEKV